MTNEVSFSELVTDFLMESAKAISFTDILRHKHYVCGSVDELATDALLRLLAVRHLVEIPSRDNIIFAAVVDTMSCVHSNSSALWRHKRE